MNKKYIVSVVVVLVVALVSFYGGMTYGGNNVRASLSSRSGGFNAGIRGIRGGGSGGFTTGSVISKDATSITLSVVGGGSKIIFLDNNTKIAKSAVGTLADLTIGTQVSITGTPNSDGSVNAQTVQIRPAVVK